MFMARDCSLTNSLMRRAKPASLFSCTQWTCLLVHCTQWTRFLVQCTQWTRLLVQCTQWTCLLVQIYKMHIQGSGLLLQLVPPSEGGTDHQIPAFLYLCLCAHPQPLILLVWLIPEDLQSMAKKRLMETDPSSPSSHICKKNKKFIEK